MRKIGLGPIIVFSTLVTLAALCGGVLTWGAVAVISLGRFTGVAHSFLFVCLFYGFAIVLYRAFLAFFDLPSGKMIEKSVEEFTYNVHLLCNLILFYPLILSKILPVPIMRLLYIALGAKFGENTYSAGTIMDSVLTKLGDNTIVGLNAIVTCHSVEGKETFVQAVSIGSNVTIGVNSVILPGVTIGDGAIVGIGSLVTKGTKIGPGETWVGLPARKLPRKTDELETEQR